MLTEFSIAIWLALGQAQVATRRLMTRAIRGPGTGDRAPMTISGRATPATVSESAERHRARRPAGDSPLKGPQWDHRTTHQRILPPPDMRTSWLLSVARVRKTSMGVAGFPPTARRTDSSLSVARARRASVGAWSVIPAPVVIECVR